MSPLIVRGNPTTEELAAVVALLRRESPRPSPQRGHDQYARWRRVRLAAVRIPR